MTRPSIAVVGAGPAGCYAAQALSKALPEAEITVLERLPVPFGLLRYGVAADHQGTKAVQQQFERLFGRADAGAGAGAGAGRGAGSGVGFVGGVELGRDVHLDELAALFDAVVLATGLHRDRRLGVEGEGLAGVVGAGVLTRALNSYPGDGGPAPTIGPRVAVVGSGNVAADLLRLLSKTAEEWEGSDMDERVLAAIVPRPVAEIHLVARSTAETARWDAAMIREFATLRGPAFRLAGTAAEPMVEQTAEPAASPAARALSDLLAASRGRTGSPLVHFHFGAVVERVLGRGRVAGVRVLAADGARSDLEVDSVLTAIGFERGPGERVPDGERPHGVYAAGWLRTGPRGTIPDQRALAKQLAAEIVADLRSGAVTPGRPGRAGLAATRTTSFEGWRRIDELERRSADAGRVRRKILAVDEMFTAATAAAGHDGAHEERASG